MKTSIFLLFFLATYTFADEVDLRPIWIDDQTSSSLLYSFQQPSFLSPTFGQQMASNQNINQIEQQYENRSRDYEMRQSYGIVTQRDQSSYVSDVSGMSKSMFTAARMMPLHQYQQNFHQSENNGDVSEPVKIVGGATAMASGSPVSTNLNDSSKVTWSGNAMNQSSELNVVSPIVNTKAEVNMKNASQDPTQPLNPNLAIERYKVSVNRDIVYKVNSSIVYGSTSSSVSASVSRPIIPNLSGSLGTTRPVGNDISSQPSEVMGALSYGFHF